MNKYTFKCNHGQPGRDAAYAIGHMYALWADRQKINFWFNCHPTEDGQFCLGIDYDLSSELGVHRYVWMPPYEECRGRRYTCFVIAFKDGEEKGYLEARQDMIRSYVLAPYKKIHQVGTEIDYLDKQVDKILNGKIPWLQS